MQDAGSIRLCKCRCRHLRQDCCSVPLLGDDNDNELYLDYINYIFINQFVNFFSSLSSYHRHNHHHQQQRLDQTKKIKDAKIISQTHLHTPALRSRRMPPDAPLPAQQLLVQIMRCFADRERGGGNCLCHHNRHVKKFWDRSE